MTAMSMSDLVPVVEVPSSRAAWRKYVETQIEDGAGWGGETELLRVLAGRVSDGGVAVIGMPLLMRKLKKSESTVREYFARLRARGVLRTHQRGRGRLAAHELVADPVVRQLSLLEDVGRGHHVAAPADPPVRMPAAESPPLAAAGTGPATTAPATASPPVDRRKASGTPDPAVKGQRTATEEEGARERAHTASTAVSPSLHAVLEVLEDAPGLHVVDAAVNATLVAFPDGDHVRAARRVASWAHEGGLSMTAANRLLWRALERAAAPPPGSCSDGRRRHRPPARPVAEHTRQRDDALRRMMERAGLGDVIR